MPFDNSEYNSLIFPLLASPSKIEMYHDNKTKIENNSKLTIKLGPLTLQDITLNVHCMVYDAKPAVKITWEYNGRKLDPKTNSAHCFDENIRPTFDCIRGFSKPSGKDPSQFVTRSYAKVTVGRKNLNKLRCLAHHPALQHRNREMHSEVTLEMEKKGKFKVQQIFKKYLGVLCVYFELMNKAVTILYIFYKNEIAVLLFQHHGFQKKLGNHP